MNAADAPAGKTTLLRTPLHALHSELGGKLVPFAGYEMPVNYPMGILGEHLHTRQKAGLFDVSHMGQAFLVGPGHEATARALEKLVPGELVKLGRGRLRYTMLLNEKGGILDDLMVTRLEGDGDDGRLMLVVNAACKEADYAFLEDNLPNGVKLERADNLALIALQGPLAAEILARWCPAARDMGFMTGARAEFDGIACRISRSGYTGEDGYEVSCSAREVERVARKLLSHEDVAPIGLGARDSLRLEAGLCLYGHDIDTATSPVEADLAWAIGKRRREEGGFNGAARILKELEKGPSRLRVGIRPDGKAPAREGTEIRIDNEQAGTVTSGSFGPSLGAPVAMGYVPMAASQAGTALELIVRGQVRPARVAALPFVPHRYHKARSA
ncbi:MAG: glycine cleavage system aminomethyltransferase GcvT [Pseudomonadota bacterium]|nr:glycine cleavage system aminomethyltransferase GcvT [Pseudomonadota bacterium]